MKTINRIWVRPMVTVLAVFLMQATNLGAQQVLSAQPEDWFQWTATDAGDQFSLDVAVDGFGCSYVAGYFTSVTTDFLSTSMGNVMTNTSSLGTEDGFLTKFDKVSNTWLWSVQVGGTGSDRCSGVATIPDGGGGYSIYVVGTFSATATFQSMDGNNVNLSSSGGKDGFLAKYDQDGNLIWVYDIGGTGMATHDYAYKVSVNYVDPPGTVNRDIYVVGLNGSGTALVCYGTSTNLNPAYSWGGADGYLLNYNESGATVTPTWIRTIGSSGTEDLQCVASMPGSVSVGGVVKTGGVLQLTASTTTALTLSGSGDAIVANYNSAGNNVWHQEFGGSGSTPEIATCVTLDADGNTYAGGFYSSSGSIFSCTPSGKHSFVVKTNPAGTLLWSKCGGSSGDDFPMGIRVDGCQKHLFVAGNFQGSTFTFQTASINGVGSGSTLDNFFLELDPATGTYLTGTAQTLGSTATDIVYATAIDRLDRIYTVGASDGQWRPLNVLSWLNNAGGYDGFIWRYNEAWWPATCDLNVAWESKHCGVSVSDCNIYCFGDMVSMNTGPGTEVSYAGIPLSSTVGFDNTCSAFPSSDIYLTTCDRFGHYTGFTNVVNGTADEYAINQTMCNNGDLLVGGYAHSYCAGGTVVAGSSSTTLTYYGLTPNWYAITYGLVTRTTSAGVPLWSALVSPNNTSSLASVSGVDVDEVNNAVYICGAFTGNITIGTTTLNTLTTSVAGFVAKFNATTGAFIWAKRNVSDVLGGYAFTTDISVDKFSPYNVYVTGTYTTRATCNGASSVALPVISGSDIFVACCSPTNGDLVGTPLTYATTSGTNDGSGRLLMITPQEIYVTGVLDGIGAFIGECEFIGTPSWPAVTTSTGAGSGVGDIIFDDSYVYVSGGFTGGDVYASVTFVAPSVTDPNSGASVLKMDRFSLTPVCLGVRNFNGGGVGIAQDNVTGNIYTAGLGTGGMSANTFGFIQEYSPESCDYSDRHANPGAASSAGTTGTLLTSASIYPNPANETAILKISEGVDLETQATLLIMDMTGRIVKRVDGIGSTETSIDLTDMQPGIYLFEVLQNNYRIGAGTIVRAQ